MVELEFRDKTKALIDSLKSICANYGLATTVTNSKLSLRHSCTNS